MNKVTVVVLSGGKSARFWPLPHKMIMPVMGKTFLDQQLEAVQAAGFTNIVLVVNDQIAARTASENIKIVTQVGQGQAAGVLSARAHISDGPLLIINANDIISPTLFTSIYQKAQAGKNVLVGRKTERYFPGGYFELDGQKIKGIVEKPGKGNEPSAYTRLVCDYFANGTAFVAALSKNTQTGDDVYEQSLTQLMQQGMEFEMVAYEDTWIPVKYPWHFLDVMSYFLQTITKTTKARNVMVHETAQLTGPIVLEEGVRILEFAKLVGPLYVGAGTIIGNHTLVRNSIIGENSVIGFNSDITRSYIGDNCWFHSNYVGDSVLANNIGMGAGATLANLRLDENEIYSTVKGEKIPTHKTKLGAMIGDGVRIGVGSYIMPGIKIGAGSVVGAGVILAKDLGEAEACFVEQSLSIKKNAVRVKTSRDAYRKKI